MTTDEISAQAFVAERCSPASVTMLRYLVDALIAENSNQNLISKGSLEHVWQRHIADSAQLLDHVSRETSDWMDLGSGAGFPGIVLATMRPEASFTLVESRRKRIEWLHTIIAELGLKNCHVAGMRLELIESSPQSVITARAFAPLPKLLKLSARFSTEATTWLLPKGRSAAQEVRELGRNRVAVFHVEQSKTDPDAGIAIGKSARSRKTT